VVRSPTAAEAAQARVTLGQIDPGVVDRLLHKVGFSRSDSSVILSGSSWVLETYTGPKDDYVAAVDGSGMHHVDLSSAGATVPQSAPAQARGLQGQGAGRRQQDPHVPAAVPAVNRDAF
jgi:hypothetical protein